MEAIPASSGQPADPALKSSYRRPRSASVSRGRPGRHDRGGGSLCRRMVGYGRPHRAGPHHGSESRRRERTRRMVDLAQMGDSSRPRCGLRRNRKSQSRRNIAAHYDLGNDFFASFLDPTMTYSCAVFPGTARATLEHGSRHKLDLICRKLELSPGDDLLEIGSGWGSLALARRTPLRLPRGDDDDLARADRSRERPSRPRRRLGRSSHGAQHGLPGPADLVWVAGSTRWSR